MKRSPHEIRIASRQEAVARAFGGPTVQGANLVRCFEALGFRILGFRV